MRSRWILLLLAVCLCLSACGKKNSPDDDAAPAETAEKLADYPGMIGAAVPGEDRVELFGVMHALVLNVQKDGSSSPVFTLRDDNDPENAWTVDTAYVKDVAEGIEKGSRVALFFMGDIMGDPDRVTFEAVWPDGDYEVKTADGTTVESSINNFTMKEGKTAAYRSLTFTKNNCISDKDAVTAAGGDKVRVVYVDSHSGEMYPLRIYSLKEK